MYNINKIQYFERSLTMATLCGVGPVTSRVCRLPIILRSMFFYQLLNTLVPSHLSYHYFTDHCMCLLFGLLSGFHGNRLQLALVY